ncbi:Torsin-1B [Armadillidium nasatum]|uniref:Torsin-1B n=1 Tax=Armadillidium nasatum TaxID=96803 RepID=A0A5N5SMT1_9CRUS|nr:Torsin-1B [Armadillidium nasatum]
MPSFVASFAFLLILNNMLIAESTFGVEYWGIPTVMAVGASLYKNFDKFLGCRFSECCSLRTGSGGWMPVNISGLASSLDNNLHGQHLVKNIVLKSLKAHFSNRDPSKLQIQDWIRGNVSDCENSLFIFDEIDKMPVGMIDGIKPFIDYHESIFGVNFRKSVFLFLSNTGSREIIQKTLQNWKEGKERTSISYSDMEELIQKGAFNEQGGLHQSDLIHHSLIDFYVPFLPLERKHIELKVADDMIYFPPENQLFSTKGCKSVSSKVGFMLNEDIYEGMFN